MRNYWMRIALGASAIFAVGMIGVTLARRGLGRRSRWSSRAAAPSRFRSPSSRSSSTARKFGTLQRIKLLCARRRTRCQSVELQVRLGRFACCARGLEAASSWPRVSRTND